VGYRHGSHAEAMARGRGDWVLRTYRDAGGPTRTADAPGLPPPGALPMYFCAVHLLALDLTQPSTSLGECRHAPLPVATLPAWACSLHSPQVPARSARPVDLTPRCTQGVLPLASHSDLRASTSQLALIRRCRHEHAVRWIACMKNDPSFWHEPLLHAPFEIQGRP
jgi:hypothetical protein